MTIPKKIHYCWLSGEPIPKDLQKCMQTWRDKLPEYELVLWDKNKFDINSVDFVREACAAKKWASAADYIRAYALYTEGGVYLDSDVIVRKSFDDFLQYDFFTAVECAASVVGKLEQPRLQAAIMGGIKGHPYLKDILNWYGTHHFTDTEYNIKLVAPDVYAQIAEKYGFQHKNELQVLKNNMVIFPSAVFAMSADSATREAFAVHCCKSSWREHQFYLQCVIRNKLLRKLFGKRPLKNISDVLKESF